MLTSTALPRQRFSGRAVFLFKALFSVALLGWLLHQTDLHRLASQFRSASLPWLACALGLYLAMVVASAWRWGLLLATLPAIVPRRWLVNSFLVATFFNNILPSNIGGDVVRVRDTSEAAGSTTRAATVVVVDRILGLLALLLVAAAAASLAARLGGPATPIPSLMLWLWFAVGVAAFLFVLMAPERFTRLLSPIRGRREWVDSRLSRLTAAVAALRAAPSAVLKCFAWAIGVQAILVAFYAAIAQSLTIPISLVHLAVVVPMALAAQLLPVSVNGFGVREATFSYYFAGLRLPVESAVALSLVGAGLILLFSLSGGVLYLTRQSWPAGHAGGAA